MSACSSSKARGISNFLAVSSAVSFLRLDIATISKSPSDWRAGMCPYLAQPPVPIIPTRIFSLLIAFSFNVHINGIVARTTVPGYRGYEDHRSQAQDCREDAGIQAPHPAHQLC